MVTMVSMPPKRFRFVNLMTLTCSCQHLRQPAISFFMFSPPQQLLTLDTWHSPFSLDHLVRPRQHIRRNRKTDLLRCLEIDHQLELHWLLYRKISGLGAL
jgi:hypothetical protein